MCDWHVDTGEKDYVCIWVIWRSLNTRGIVKRVSDKSTSLDVRDSGLHLVVPRR